MASADNLPLEGIPEGRLLKPHENLRKRRVSIKSSRVQRHSNAGLCTSTRQRRMSAQRGTQRKRSLHHLFGYPPVIPPDNETSNEGKDNSRMSSVITSSRRLSLAVNKRPTFTAVEPTTGRRRSEPYVTNMFTTILNTNTKRNSRVGLPHGRKVHGGRKFSTAEALMIKNNRRLEALAQDELLTCLNVPLSGESTQISTIDENAETENDDSFVFISVDGDYISDEENERRIKERKEKDEKRKCIVRELYETEQNYISCLDIVLDVFKTPLESRNIVSQKDLKQMFPSSLNDILNSHRRFLHDLDGKLNGDRWEVGGCFQKMTSASADLLDVYTRYVQSFPKSISTLTKYTRGSNKFRKFLDSCYHNPIVERLDLPSFLLSPVQRLPRYILLLSELYKYTELGHPDKDVINVTSRELEEIISSLDTSIKVSMESYKSPDSRKKSVFRKHFPTTKKKKRTPSSCNENEKKNNGKKSSNTSSTTCSSSDSPVRKISNRNTPETARSLSPPPAAPPPPPLNSPVRRRRTRTYDGCEDNVNLNVEIKRDRNNSWRKSLGAKLSNLFQSAECNHIDSNNISHLPLGTPS